MEKRPSVHSSQGWSTGPTLWPSGITRWLHNLTEQVRTLKPTQGRVAQQVQVRVILALAGR